MRNADPFKSRETHSYRLATIVFAICACVVLGSCATVKRIVPWGNSDSDASKSRSADPQGETQSIAAETAPKTTVDLSVPAVDRNQSAISSDAAALRASTTAPQNLSEGSANATDPTMPVMADDWGLAVQRAIHARWIQPRGPKIPTDFSCDVMVKLTRFGGVDDVKVVRSCGDPALDASIETAVRDSSPLPIPKNPDDFSDTLLMTFTAR